MHQIKNLRPELCESWVCW